MHSQRRVVMFTGPRQVEVLEETYGPPRPGEVLVRALLSAISAGTEGMIYRGGFPEDVAVDETIASLQGELRYPLKYGYSTVGRVAALGEGVDPGWIGRLVFAFNPHESFFTAQPEDLQPVPEDIPAEGAIFLPNMETAINLVMDGEPMLGEDVVIYGQGVVGLLTTALLGWYPLRKLVTLDRYPMRRKISLESGAHVSFDPAVEDLHAVFPDGADLVYELSGSPAALEDAIAAAGFAGRVVIGSWYGNKPAVLNLGGRFHRSRIRLISSQVSTIAPGFRGRWDKARRFAIAWEAIRRLQPGRLITHRIPVMQAGTAYALLDEYPEQVLQAALVYED